MRRVRFSVAMSLDAYLTGPNGEYDWIVMDPDIDFAALMNSFDTLIMGRKTYEAMKKMPAGGSMPGTQVYVISRTLKQEDCPDAIVSNNAAGTVSQLKAAKGKDIWLFGGGELFRSLLSLHLVDSVEVAVIPVLLGEGLPVLPPPSDRATLKLVKHHVYPKTGIVALEYVPA